MSGMEEQVLKVFPRFFEEYECYVEAFLTAWKFCWKNKRRSKAAPWQVDIKESILDDTNLMTEAKNILDEVSECREKSDPSSVWNQPMQRCEWGTKIVGNANTFLAKAGFEYCARFTQPFLYHVVMNMPQKLWHRHAMLFILGFCVDQADKVQQNNKMRQYIIGEIYKFMSWAAEKAYIQENAAIWEIMGQIIALFSVSPFFSLNMFGPIFIYADSQDPQNCLTYELFGRTLSTLVNTGMIDHPIPENTHCLIMQFCPNLLDSGDVTRLCKLHYLANMGCNCRQCQTTEKTHYREESLSGKSAKVEASWLKEEGNGHHKNHYYLSAVAAYTRGIEYNPKDMGLMATLHSNRAASHMMLCNYGSALEDCTEALKFNPQYKKAYIRGCVCLLMLQEPAIALEWLDKHDIDIGEKLEELKAKVKAGLKSCKDGKSGNKKGKTKVEQNNNVEKPSLMDILKSHNIQFIPDLDRFVSGGGDLKDTVHLDEQGVLKWNVLVRYPTPVLQTVVKDFSETCSMRELLQTALAQTSDLDADVYSEDTVVMQYKDLTHVTAHTPDDVTMRTVHNLDVTLSDVMSRSDYTVVNMQPLFYVVPT